VKRRFRHLETVGSPSAAERLFLAEERLLFCYVALSLLAQSDRGIDVGGAP
jgi:hypothetical protein